MKATAEFWGSISEMWQTDEASLTSTGSSESAQSRPQELWDSALNIWQAMVSSLGEPGTVESVSRGISTLPEIVVKLAQTGWEGYFHLHKQWLSGLGKIGERAELFQFENLDKHVFRSWLEVYQKDLRQFLHIPQLGLTRVYQERLNRVIDKFNLFQLVGFEFLYLIYLPMEKSLRSMEEKFQDLSKEGELSDDYKEYYNLWIKTLEGHYMTLFKSPDYTKALSKALIAMGDFVQAREELLNDLLKILSFPTKEDMDEVYKEIYLLRKKVKSLEKKVNES